MTIAADSDSEAEIHGKAVNRRGFGVSKVYDALKRDILEMVIAPGDPLDEVGLAERFGLSRTPIREALVKLVAEGLATTLPNRNTIVSIIDYAGLPDYLDALLLMYRVTARSAATRRTSEDLAVMRSHQAKFIEAVQDSDALGMIETNRDFHLAIAEAAGNRFYTALFSRLLNEGTRLLRLYYRTYEDHLPQEFVDEHEELIAAIEARDPNRSESIGRKHAAQVVAQIQSFLTPTVGAEIML